MSRSRLADVDLRDDDAPPPVPRLHVGIDLARPGTRDRTVLVIQDAHARIIGRDCEECGSVHFSGVSRCLTPEEQAAERNRILNPCARCGSTNHFTSECRYLRPGDLVHTRTCNATGGLPYAGSNNADGGLPTAVKLPLRLVHDRGFPFCSSSGYYHALDADGKRCYVTAEDIACILCRHCGSANHYSAHCETNTAILRDWMER